MDENKNNTPEGTPESAPENTPDNAPESAPEENNINPPRQTEGEAAPEAGAEAPKEGKKQYKLRNAILNCICVALVLFAVIIVVRQCVYMPGEYQAPPTPAPTPEATPETPATPEPTPYIRKIPVMMYFTEREMSFPIETVGLVPYTDSKGEQIVAEDGRPVYTMGTINSGDVAAWLDASASPGEYGNAIFNGHISWKKVAGVFSVLQRMETGEEIVVEYDDGSTMAFAVESVDFYNLSDVPDTVMAYNTGDARVTLITCYGESWNSSLGTRDNRCVVVAKPKDESQVITPPVFTPAPDDECNT